MRVTNERGSSGVMWTGILLIVVSGLIHFMTAPGHFEYATYLGWLFIVQGVVSLVAAYGIYRGESWGWTLGLIMAGGAFLAYCWSRVFGLPGMPASEVAWLDPFGIVSLIVEAVFVATFIYAMSARSPRHARMHA